MIPTKAPLAMSSDSSIRFIDISAKVELRLFSFHSFMHSPPRGKYIEYQSNLCGILQMKRNPLNGRQQRFLCHPF